MPHSVLGVEYKAGNKKVLVSLEICFTCIEPKPNKYILIAVWRQRVMVGRDAILFYSKWSGKVCQESQTEEKA